MQISYKANNINKQQKFNNFVKIFAKMKYNIPIKLKKGENMKIQLSPQGVCCQQMNLEISDEDNKILNAEFYGGCPGNLQAVSKLILGMKVEEVIEKLEGISCGGKPTSCPDQLSKGLVEYLKFIQKEKEKKGL